MHAPKPHGLRSIQHALPLKEMVEDSIPWISRVKLSELSDTQSNDLFALLTTDNELCEYLKNKHALPDSQVILLRNSVPHADDQVANVIGTLRDAFRGCQLEYQTFSSTEGTGTDSESVEEFLHAYDTAHSLEDTYIIPEPKNYLSWASRLAHNTWLPRALGERYLGYTLLAKLVERVQNKFLEAAGQENLAGKDHAPQHRRHIDLESCMNFLLFGQAGTMSGWHRDILNGTVVNCLSGIKLWFWYVGPWNDEVEKDFDECGPLWEPPLEHIRTEILHPGDSLIMRPGEVNIHAVVTLKDAFMSGGMIWGKEMMVGVLKNISSMVNHPDTTNEQIPKQHPEIIAALRELMVQEGKQDVVDATDEHWEMLTDKLACHCSSKCTALCPCNKEDIRRRAGCTMLCHKLGKGRVRACLRL